MEVTPIEPQSLNNVFENKKAVVQAFERGVDRENEWGYHGTSIETLREALGTGRFPTTGSFNDEFYFVPQDSGSDEGDFDHAVTYAHWNAEKFYLLDRINFRPQNMEAFMNFLHGGCSEEQRISLYKELAEHGVSGALFHEMVREAEAKRRGVVIGLSPDIPKEFQVLEGLEDDQKKIIIPNGLPIKYITGIEPMGQYEWDELENMQKSTE